VTKIQDKVTDKAGDAAKTAGHSLWVKALPLLPPWAAAVAAGPAAHAVHMRFGGDAASSALMTLAGVALTGATWAYTSKRSLVMRAHATVSTMAGTGWLTAAAIAGMTRPLTNLYFIGGAFLALSWNIKHLTRNTGTGSGEHADGGLLEKIGLAKALIRKTKVEPNKVTLSVQLPPGELTADDVVKSRPNWASAASVPANGVRINPDPDHHDRAEVVIVPVDLLRDSPVYPGPSAPGGTMVQPLHVGLYEDGVDAVVYGAANTREDRVQANTALAGMSGAGKGVLVRALVTEIGTRREATLWVVDVVKRTQTLGPAARVIDWFATTRDQADAMIDCLPDVISVRTDYLASRGLDNWEPGCGINHLTILFEEFAPLLRDVEAMVDITAAVRSAGIKIVFSGQRFTHDNLPTSVRANIGEVICLGVKDVQEAGYLLGPDLVVAGADPSVWTNKKPGYAYITGPGIPEDRYTTALRSFGQPFARDLAQIDEILAAYEHLRDAPDQLTAMAAGPAYANRTTGPAVMAALRGEPVPATAMASTPASSATATAVAAALLDDDDDFEEEDLDDDEIPAEVLRKLNVAAVPDAPDPDLLRRAMKLGEGALPAAPALRFDGGDPDELEDEDEVSTAEAEEMVNDAIRRAIAMGRTVIRPKDLVPILDKAGRSRPWLQGYLKVLVNRQALSKGNEPGEYKMNHVAFERETAGV
jgi:hypothetical protein